MNSATAPDRLESSLWNLTDELKSINRRLRQRQRLATITLAVNLIIFAANCIAAALLWFQLYAL